MNLSFSDFYNSLPTQLIEEGGAYGHMANVHEVWSLTFFDLKQLMRLALSGGVSMEVKEKTDGQALAFSYSFRNVDELKGGKIIFARNAGHYRARGVGGLRGSKGVAEAFVKHPGPVRDAFAFAAKDIEAALNKLDPEVLHELFDNGARWVNMEIIDPENENVIPYGDHNLLVLHNFRQYDDEGNVVAGDFNRYGEHIAKLLRKTNLDVQAKFKITSMPMLSIPKVTDHDKHRDRLQQPIDAIQREYNLTDDNIAGDYWVAYMKKFILDYARSIGYNLDSRLDIVDRLAYRWAFKSTKPRPHDYNQRVYKTITMLKKDLPVDTNAPEIAKDFKDWVSRQDSNIATQHTMMLDDLRLAFAEVGMIVIQNISNLLTLNPTAAVKKMRRRLEQAIQKVKMSGDAQSIATVDKHLNTIERLGGLDAIVPTEGITFTYTPKGKSEQITLKYTGNFGAVNQIIGMDTYGR